MLDDLKGRAVLVTGASTGIGAAVAGALGRLGARVGVHFHRSRGPAEEIVDEIRRSGGEAAAFPADLTRSEAVETLVAAFIDRFGRLDVLINNAGDLIARTPFLDVTDDYYDRVMNLNARAVMVGCRAAIRQFLAQGGGGVIVNTGSVAGRHGGRPGSLLYAGSKAFVHSMTRGLAKEYACAGIRVNAVAPGVVVTPFHDRHSTARQLEAIAGGIPMGRLGRPDDCVGAYLFLASNAMSGYVTGQTIDVNGGMYTP